MPVDRTRRPVVGADPLFVFPRIERHRLANGLDVRTVEHPGVPVVTFAVLVRGGSATDPPGYEGVAGLTADMLDEGTGALGAIEVSDALSRIGADYEVDVGPDTFLVRLTTLVRFADRGAELLADLLVRPALREDDIMRVRQLRLDRLRQLREHAPSVADRQFLSRAYGQHPYGHTSIGTSAALGAITASDVRQCHATLFRPAAAVVMAVGAMSSDALRHSVERVFGPWEPGAASETPAVAPVTETPAAATFTVVARPGAAQSELRLGRATRALRDGVDYPSLIVMNAVLGGQFVSRVNLKLREEKGFTYGARTSLDWRKNGALFSLDTSVHTASTAEAISDAISEVSDIRGPRPPSPRELELAKASLTRGYPRNFETNQQVARSVSTLAAFDLPDTYFSDFTARVHAVTIDDVVRVASEHLSTTRLVGVVVGDADAVTDSIRSLQLGAVEVVPSQPL